MAWVIIPVEINSNRQVVLLNQKLPAYLTCCKGVICSVKTKLPADKTATAELSLSLNSHRIHPIHIEIKYCKYPVGKHNNPYILDEPLIPNGLLTGYFMDKTAENYFHPYQVQIYLQCTKA